MSRKVIVRQGDCIEVMHNMPGDSVDSIVTDPPYELGFMGKSWDNAGISYSIKMWAQCLRVLKPGGHLAAFGGTRTYHRMACAIEDAGFEIRDSLHWIYGSGFPKSHDVSKAIDKQAGAEREVTGKHANPAGNKPGGASLNMSAYGMPVEADITAPATPEAKQWEGFGTALKPAHEPIILARKPFKGTVAANTLEYGTGALNIDASRIGTDKITTHSRGVNTAFPKRPGETSVEESGRIQRQDGISTDERTGRWPPNILLDESAAAEMDAQSGNRPGSHTQKHLSPAKPGIFGAVAGIDTVSVHDVYNDMGGASRFFPVFKYQAKAPTRERPTVDGVKHPTVKPLALMEWLVTLVTPTGGTVLDPFAGTGTTGLAARNKGFRAVLIEQNPDYIKLIRKRLE